MDEHQSNGPQGQNEEGGESPLSVVYLDVQKTLLEHCGENCPWLGLFHVDVPVWFFSTFIADVRRYLIPTLYEALREFERQGDTPPTLDFDYFVRHYQMHMWASRAKGGQPHDPQLAEAAPVAADAAAPAGASNATVCYLVAVSPTRS